MKEFAQLNQYLGDIRLPKFYKARQSFDKACIEREDIPVEPSRDSLTNEMIIKFKSGEV